MEEPAGRLRVAARLEVCVGGDGPLWEIPWDFLWAARRDKSQFTALKAA